ncbi:endonuclease/exonuclease/phosphatase family protein [Trifolium medium]|uniref:Endonuclease/exonuclease/phosphatase family protein n=1 Tax=Trifolium medium TaxID=97028 RepID=A0A392PTG2_9FABA|nr:endonuclease/exonuclease/phosphatase family protein [Trifolium medium]
MALKEWHDSHVRNLPGRIDNLKARLSVLDGRVEEEVSTADEVAELRGITSDIHSLSHVNTSICWQQSRVLWLREGDANSKYFHSPVRQAVFTHFSSHFHACNMARPSVEDLQFHTLSFTKGGSLVKPFSVDEVKAAI